MANKLVSIMMPAYNAEKFIRSAIESVLAQTYPDWELIVVNDGSSDQTANIVEQFLDPRIRLIEQQNSGEAVARNTALREMKGEYVAFLDADDMYLENHLELTVEALESYPEWDGVYTDGVHIDTLGNELPTLSSRRRGPFQGWIFEQLVRASDVFGPPICVVLRRDKIVASGTRFDSRIVIGPDWDFFTRFSENSRFGYVNRITCKYRIHKTNISLEAKQHTRIDSLALCRKKAIMLGSFYKCSDNTRVYAFYDLLVNLLSGNPQEQDEVVNWPQFKKLPNSHRARILRIIAGREIASGGEIKYAKKWLDLSRSSDPYDIRGIFLGLTFRISPNVLSRVLRKRYENREEKSIFTPFSDLDDYLL
jgi:glycosyltransferase involved in cell wall biosynthesis